MRGIHIIADFYDCEYDFSKEQNLLPFCKILCRNNGLNIVGETSNIFSPQGFTFVLLLAESHLSVHTWPEKREVAFDIYTCNDSSKQQIACQEIMKQFKIEIKSPKSISQTLFRGNVLEKLDAS